MWFLGCKHTTALTQHLEKPDTEVLQSLQKSMEKPPKPFPLSDQYVNAVAPTDANLEGGEEATGTPPEPKKRKTNCQKKNPPKKLDKNDSDDLAKPDWNYSQIRSEWIKEYRDKNSVGFAEAKTAWDSSAAKKQYLGPVSIQELKRRKFLSKDSEVNPWA